MSVQSLDGIGYVDPYTSLVSAVAIPSRDEQARSAVPETTVNVSARQRWIDVFDALVKAPTAARYEVAGDYEIEQAMMATAVAHGLCLVPGVESIGVDRRRRTLSLVRDCVVIATALWPSEAVAHDVKAWSPAVSP